MLIDCTDDKLRRWRTKGRYLTLYSNIKYLIYTKISIRNIPYAKSIWLGQILILNLYSYLARSGGSQVSVRYNVEVIWLTRVSR
mgnify:CR=1 FL=1